ncbi:MAG: hypothetical protein M1831_001672 [Alyxoria varia]|nr:MAG: hypothetical protein M1831_001672 [Alyxoria varia]
MGKNDSHEEFPTLTALGLYAADTLGDGNCLFNAFSDQLYGHPEKHRQIRLDTITHMRNNKDDFLPFLDVQTSTGTRRQPRRKAANAYASTNVGQDAPSSAEIQKSWENYLGQKEQGGTYGDHVEIQAFAIAYNVNVRIYQRDNVLVISPKDQNFHTTDIYVAFHTWEHYSSIRNIDGPHSGPPNVQSRTLDAQEKRKVAEQLVSTPVFAPWQLETVMVSCPFLPPRDHAIQALTETRGNVNDAVDKLIEEHESARFSSSSASSSAPSNTPEIEMSDAGESRDPPSKKQDRRLSRNTKSALRHRKEQNRRIMMSELQTRDNDSLESLINVLPPVKRGGLPQVDENGKQNDEMLRRNLFREDYSDSLPPLKDSDTSSGSEYSQVAQKQPEQKPVPKLQLHYNPKAGNRPQGLVKKAATNAIPPKRVTGQGKNNLTAARDVKATKKQTQKANAKERKRAHLKSSYPREDTPFTGSERSSPSLAANGGSGPGMTNNFRVLHI